MELHVPDLNLEVWALAPSNALMFNKSVFTILRPEHNSYFLSINGDTQITMQALMPDPQARACSRTCVCAVCVLRALTQYYSCAQVVCGADDLTAHCRVYRVGQSPSTEYLFAEWGMHVTHQNHSLYTPATPVPLPESGSWVFRISVLCTDLSVEVDFRESVFHVQDGLGILRCIDFPPGFTP